jgi:hypothetical protein
MKTVYIPKGETVSYETLETERLVVKGCLKVAYSIKARTISGNGVIVAGTVSADDILVDDLEAASVTCQRLIAKRVQTPELFAFESAAVSCLLSSAYVAAGKLTVALSEIDEVKADEVIHLKPRKRSLFRLLLASALRSFWTSLTARPQTSKVMDADFEPIKDSRQEEQSTDEELNRIVGMFKLARKSGYTLKLIPGTPEKNAPVLDVKTGKIIRPAA